MKVSVDKLNDCIDKFVTTVIVPGVKSPMTLFKLGVASSVGALKVTPEHVAAMKGYGLVDKEGLVDLDALKKVIYDGFDLSGSLPINQLSLTFYKADADKFFHFVETGSLT